jgi:hypothetical protein
MMATFKHPGWEALTQGILDRCSILEVLQVQVADFAYIYRSAPTLVIINRKCKGAFVREVMAQQKVYDPYAAVAEPIWLGDVPVIFGSLKEDFMHVLNNDASYKETL